MYYNRNTYKVMFQYSLASIILLIIARLSCTYGFRTFSSNYYSFNRILKLSLIKDIYNKNELDIVTLSNSNGLVIIDFQKSQCKPCIRVAPIYKELSEKYQDDSNVNFYKVDADSSPDALALLKELNIRSVPTFHIWNQGVKIDEVRGAHMDELTDIIADQVKKNNTNK